MRTLGLGLVLFIQCMPLVWLAAHTDRHTPTQPKLNWTKRRREPETWVDWTWLAWPGLGKLEWELELDIDCIASLLERALSVSFSLQVCAHCICIITEHSRCYHTLLYLTSR